MPSFYEYVTPRFINEISMSYKIRQMRFLPFSQRAGAFYFAMLPLYLIAWQLNELIMSWRAFAVVPPSFCCCTRVIGLMGFDEWWRAFSAGHYYWLELDRATSYRWYDTQSPCALCLPTATSSADIVSWGMTPADEFECSFWLSASGCHAIDIIIFGRHLRRFYAYAIIFRAPGLIYISFQGFDCRYAFDDYGFRASLMAIQSPRSRRCHSSRQPKGIAKDA